MYFVERLREESDFQRQNGNARAANIIDEAITELNDLCRSMEELDDIILKSHDMPGLRKVS